MKYLKDSNFPNRKILNLSENSTAKEGVKYLIDGHFLEINELNFCG